ncbi:MAG: hypothetical protein ABIU54_06150, partial [Candidatus Eisenbacteria bacterium]
PERSVDLHLSVEHSQRLRAAINLDSDRVLAVTHTSEQEEVRYDLELGRPELLTQLPVRQGALQLDSAKASHCDPGCDDGEVMVEAAAGNTPRNHTFFG